MAKSCYNTFVVIDCRSRKILLVTSSARKANDLLVKGAAIEVWCANERVERIHAQEKEREPMRPYIEAERDFIGRKQKIAERRNKRW